MSDISDNLRRFFESEIENWRTGVANGDIEPGSPLDLDAAYSSLQQAPTDVVLAWLTEYDSFDDVDQQDPAEVENLWMQMFDTLMEFTALVVGYGSEARLTEFL